ncbi:hypothetical protein JTE90_017037 [Oedothorax gibbosus]|uniref:N-acetyltransferase domain-containing protein n=1 Tax=Oedothorax gibbosus TaxID=931172 RepID=A0AAV6UMI5_9ARAC|nr:hypothetical protein JTE90_017037 [Oedothorax gibbosus]
MKSELSFVLLHERPEYLKDCAVLLSNQWKRSLSARIQSIEKSYKDLPDSLLLLESVDNEPKVIGHSRLTRVLEDSDGCWIGSVVIAEEKRGLGFGKLLMQKSEEHAKQFGFLTAYLNTKDKQGFYEHLGYTYGEPVTMVASKSHPLMNKNSSLSQVKSVTEFPSKACTLKSDPPNYNPSPKQEGGNISTLLPPPPPPPPPMPQNKLSGTNNSLSNLGQYWMKKTL